MNSSYKEIIWNESFSVGVKKIDEEHKTLLDLLNRLNTKTDLMSNSERTDDALNEMTQYAINHFKTEEDIFRAYNYEEFDIHRNEHLRFFKKISKYSDRLNSGEQDLLPELIDELANWIISHILNSDMRCKAFFKKNGIS